MPERFTSPVVQRWCRRLGWGLLLLTSIFILLMPTQLSTDTFSPDTILMIYVLLLAVGLGGFVGAVLFLIPAYPALFRRPWGLLICLALIQMLILIMNKGFLVSDLGWLGDRLALLLVMWGAAAMVALGIVLIFYLAVNDHSVSLTLLTALLAVWVMVFYMRQLGPEQLLSQTVTDQTGLALMPPVVCLSFWVLLLAPLAFLGHTLRLIGRELQGEDIEMEDVYDSRMAGEF